MIKGCLYRGAQLRISPTLGNNLRLTENFEFACIQACAGPLLTAYIYEYRLHQDGLRVFEFEIPNLQWLMYEVYDRNILTQENAPSLYREIIEFENQYDVIVGPEIDDRSYYLCHAFWAPMFPPLTFDYHVLLEVLRKSNLSLRVALKTEKAYHQIEEVGMHIVSPKERREYEALAEKRVIEANELQNNLAEHIPPRYVQGLKDIMGSIESGGYSFTFQHPFGINYNSHLPLCLWSTNLAARKKSLYSAGVGLWGISFLTRSGSSDSRAAWNNSENP